MIKTLVRRFGAAMLLAPLALGPLACGEADLLRPDAEGVPGSELAFLRFAPDAGGGDGVDFSTSGSLQASHGDGSVLLTTDTSFVATHGEALLVEFFYEPETEDEEVGDRFLRFELGETSLAHYPSDHPMEGAAFASGDTVTISIQASSDTLLAKFAPAGLEFDSDAPAELEVSYLHAEYDPDLEEDIDLWKQESEGEPWYSVGEIQHLDIDVIQATLTSFTRYAMAI